MTADGVARPDLDLSDILPAYQSWIRGQGTSTAGINRIHATPEGDRWKPMEVGDEGMIPQRLYERRPERDLSTPWRVGNGPAECSTSQVMVSARPMFAWDVNGWYRKIGVPFPYVDATQGVLSRSYMASGGQRSPMATYYLRRLLNRPVRALYDTMPLGEPFLDDDYVQQALKMRAAEEAGRRSKHGTYTKPETVMDEWGYNLLPNDEEGIDSPTPAVQDEVPPEKDSYDPVEWVYSYWTWQTRTQWSTTVDLEKWQALLVSAFAQQGARLTFAVGRSGKVPHPFTVGYFDGHWIVFLNEKEQPTPDLAARAAVRMVQLITEQHDSLDVY